MRRCYLFLTLGAIVFISSDGVCQFPRIELGLTVSDAADTSRTVYWGVDTNATLGIDPLLGEEELPPWPYEGTIEVRWVSPPHHSSHAAGIFVDLRHYESQTQVDTYRVRFQPGLPAGYPMKLKWNKNSVNDLYGCSVTMATQTNFSPQIVDMKTADSLVVTDTTISYVLLYAACPYGPNSIAGKVIDDLNGNSVDDNEPGVSGWKVYLSGSKNDSLQTDSEGYYRFESLLIGTYTVQEEHKVKWLQTAPESVSYTMSLTRGQHIVQKDFSNFKFGEIHGVKFNDDNANGIFDIAEVPISNWKIILGGARAETTQTNAQGEYSFGGLLIGSYTVKERQDSTYVQTKPGYPGYYSANITTSGAVVSGFDFGNKPANVFTPSGDSLWSNPNNWSSGHVPGTDEVVVISFGVVVDSLPNDTLTALRIAPGGSITYSAIHRLVLLHLLQIDSGSSLSFHTSSSRLRKPNDGEQTGLVCYGSWINNGIFEPGTSLISFDGDIEKQVTTTTFYDMEILGENTSSLGNISIQDKLILSRSFDLRQEDTIEVLNPFPDAVVDTGIVEEGTIIRTIDQATTGTYRFESPSTTIMFTSDGTSPTSVAMTALPDTTPPAFQLKWQVVGGVVDSINHTITADSIGQFSKWAFGVSRPNLTGSAIVPREYIITVDGGGYYQAEVQLRYDQSEVPMGTSESSLQLLRGPCIADSVASGWNIVSLPVIPHDFSKAALFPQAISNAYNYHGGYTPQSMFSFGDAYWLKFPASQAIQVVGDDVEKNTLIVDAGWHMVGMLSFPLSTRAVTSSPAGIISSRFFRYNKSYQIVDSLKPMHGYWVKTKAPGKLIFEVPTSSFGKTIERPSAEIEQLNMLDVSDASGSKQRLYFSAGSLSDLSMYDLPPVPPPGIFDARYISQRLVEAPDEKMVKDIPIVVSSAAYPLTLMWDVKDDRALAWLVIGAKEVKLSRYGTMQLGDSTVQLKLKLVSHSLPEKPKEFTLFQNYPNPFNPRTTIQYTLPEQSKVVLKVYNILGQEIMTLVDEVQDAGYKSVEWDAGSLPSGVYMYKLVAGTFIDVKKMLMIK